MRKVVVSHLVTPCWYLCRFLFVGSMKLIMPVEAFLAQMPIALPGLFIRFIGVIEVAGALGLILPRLTCILLWLTPLVACGLALEMIGASVLFPAVVGLLAVVVASGRHPWAQAAASPFERTIDKRRESLLMTQLPPFGRHPATLLANVQQSDKEAAQTPVAKKIYKERTTLWEKFALAFRHHWKDLSLTRLMTLEKSSPGWEVQCNIG